MLASPDSETDYIVQLREVETLAADHYGIQATASRLSGERDQNFLLTTDSGMRWVLKVPGVSESPQVTDLLVSVLRHLEVAAPDLRVPRVRLSVSGASQIEFEQATGTARHAVVYDFLPGTPLIDVLPTVGHSRTCGTMLATLTGALRAFAHPMMHRDLIWDLKRLPRLLDLLPYVSVNEYGHFPQKFLREFSNRIAPRLESLPSQFVHNDFNGRNIIVDSEDHSTVVGVIDFGDAVYTARAIDLAVGITGQLHPAQDSMDVIAAFVDAYSAVLPLSAAELDVLDWLIAGRIVQSVVITSWYRVRDPDNTHFADFDRSFYGWRVELAKRLVAKHERL